MRIHPFFLMCMTAALAPSQARAQDSDYADTNAAPESTAANAETDLPTADAVTAADDKPAPTALGVKERAAAASQAAAYADAERAWLVDGITQLQETVADLDQRIQALNERLAAQQEQLDAYMEKSLALQAAALPSPSSVVASAKGAVRGEPTTGLGEKGETPPPG